MTDPHDWRCTARAPDGSRCPHPARIGIHAGPRLCKRHAWPEGHPATSQPEGWPADYRVQDGHDSHH